MSNAKNCLSHTKKLGIFFFFFNGCRAVCPAFLKDDRRALTLGIFKKPQDFLLKHYGRPGFI